MIGQFIHGSIKRRNCEILFYFGQKRPPELIPVSLQFRMVLVRVLFHSGQEIGDRFHKRIVVHDRVPLISQKPGLRFPVLLRQDNCLRIGLLDRLAESSPEFMIKCRRMSQISRHIQPPPVCIKGRRYPFFCNFKDIIAELLAALIVQLRQRVVSPPAFIAAIIGP